MTERIVDRQKVGMAFLRTRVREAAEASDKRAAEVRAKRAARKGATLPETEDVPDFDCTGEPKKRVPNATDVERWWHEGLVAAFDGRVPHEAWTVRQKVLAKKLLVTYGAEEVQRGIAETLATWTEHPGVTSGRLPTIPTFSLIYGMRVSIWGEESAGLERIEANGLVKRQKDATISDREAKRLARRDMGESDLKEPDPKKRKGIGW